MKFLLVPLLIVGMFVSFAAAGLAMLFFTEKVKTIEELEQIIRGEVDSTRLSDDFTDPEDKLGKLFSLVDEYRLQYEAEQQKNDELRDSLIAVEAALLARETAVDLREAVATRGQDSIRTAARQASAEELAVVYNKLRPGPAADILQEGTLSDTTVALLMKKLQPQQMAKIMANMDPVFAATITKIIQEL